MNQSSAGEQSVILDLYELSFEIGTSLDLSKNSHSFFKKISELKNLEQISVLQMKSAFLKVKETFSRLEEDDLIFINESPLFELILNLSDDEMHNLELKKCKIGSTKLEKIWAYKQEDLILIIVQKKGALEFRVKEQLQLAPLFQKFILTVRAAIAHKYLQDEVLKRNEAETIDSLDLPSTCSISVPQMMPVVSYDKVRLQQVFQNLISNAIKFLDKPVGRIKVLLDSNDSHYIFSIEDNEPGI
ncbi:ATP-binding protein [Bacteroidia bacterium]|nr:ATP-binding protein [Bacteroidia bacterium]